MRKKTKFENNDFYSKLAIRLSIEIVIGSFLALASLYLFLKIGHEIFENDFIFLDSTITNLIYSQRNSVLNSIMLFFTNLAGPFTLTIGALISAYLISLYRKKDAIIFLGILSSTVIVNYILKFYYQRPRPDELPLLHENSYSFPSGHAMNGFMFYSLVAYFIYRETGNIKLTFFISILSILVILMIGISRIYLGVHFPSDVLGGYIAGFVWLTFAIIFEKTIIFKRLKYAKKSQSN